jgi:hypothetical protein
LSYCWNSKREELDELHREDLSSKLNVNLLTVEFWTGSNIKLHRLLRPMLGIYLIRCYTAIAGSLIDRVVVVAEVAYR